FNGKKENKAIKQVYLKDKRLLEWVLVQIVNMKPFDKFIEPKRVTMQLKKYKKDNDIIQAFVEDIYIPNGWHECTAVPIWFIKEHLETYVADNEITTQKRIQNISGNVIRVLRELTGSEYGKERTRVEKADYQILHYNPEQPKDYPKKFNQPYDSVVKE
ncbi:MAG: DNA primase, partial [Streptococcus lutetiensis]|nr:DNA primase [Streptococcus lutetiensis]MDU2675970.1 DNA primase [Streptococcus lutetiensis]